MTVHHHAQGGRNATRYGYPQKVDGATDEAVATAHLKDLGTQEKYGVNYIKYWLDEGSGTIFCLVEAPNKEAAERVHRGAHRLTTDEIHEVKENA